jgi:type II secretory pathway pseudopilin PulG
VTLLETLVVIAVGTVVVGVAVGLIVTLFQIEKKSRQARDGIRTQARLADQFRRDARAAIDFSVAGDSEEPTEKVEWLFQFPTGERVRYGTEDARVDRTELSGDEVVRSESYRLPYGATATMELSNEEPPAVAGLRIQRGRPFGKSGSFRSLRIEALLGADHRFQKPDDSEQQEP